MSDIQFGANYRFGVDFKTEDGSIETLLGRLTDDLKEMREDYGLIPELIVLTGDLVEQAGMIKIQPHRQPGLPPLQVCFPWTLSPWPSTRSGGALSFTENCKQCKLCGHPLAVSR